MVIEETLDPGDQLYLFKKKKNNPIKKKDFVEKKSFIVICYRH